MDVYQKIIVQEHVNSEDQGKYAWKNVQLAYMNSKLRKCLMENKTMNSMTASQSQTHMCRCSVVELHFHKA